MNRRSALYILAATPIIVCAKARSASTLAQPAIIVHKDGSCRCCKLWVQHLEQNGFSVEVRNENDLLPTKERLGVPHGKEGCHTAEIDGYFVEGHVPAEDIRRLLRDRPAAKGITLPGMPEGSPGMEAPSGKVAPYDVLLVARDGSTTVYAHHNWTKYDDGPAFAHRFKTTRTDFHDHFSQRGLMYGDIEASLGAWPRENFPVTHHIDFHVHWT